MARLAASLLAFSALLGVGTSQNSTTGDSVKLTWLGKTPEYQAGASFGVPWPRGKFFHDRTVFSVTNGAGENVDVQTWETALWPDNSIKWTGHAIPATEDTSDEFTLKATSSKKEPPRGKLTVNRSGNEYRIDTGKTIVTFPTRGNIIVSKIEANGKVVGQNGKLILRSQSAPSDGTTSRKDSSEKYFTFEGRIDEVVVDKSSTVRALVTTRGKHEVKSGGGHVAWLPFTVRFYLYENSEAIKIVHTIVYDGKEQEDFISGLGITFDVPLKGEELYNRHVRFSGTDGGLLNEAVRGITGLRRDPGQAVQEAQFQGKALPDPATWDQRVTRRLQWIPPWGDYSLEQLSPDGFTLKKRTKPGHTWINIPGSTRAGGLAYLGGATRGGLAIALRDFWKRYPTSLEINAADTDTGKLTLWLYSPSAPPLDVRPYHDGLGQRGNYTAQLDALEITYEDWEENFDTPYGVARSNEIFIYAFDSTPSQERLSLLSDNSNSPPVLLASPAYIRDTKVFGNYWNLPETTGPAVAIEKNLNFLIDFYIKQVEQKRWHGFWDHGDFIHTYDVVRHQWRYDIGGYAWDNSELSPDIFFWLQFLRTGSESVYRFAEAQARHGSEVDMYHLGKWKGLGTRHGVTHWADSAKQARISQPQYRRYFYYLTGGDERVGEIVRETLDVLDTYLILDPTRKVRTDGFKPDPSALSIGLGTDFSGLAASWLLEWERRGARWEEARDRLNLTTTGIAALKNGFVTGSAIYNTDTGTLRPPLDDPTNEKGVVAVSHLSAVFGFQEVILDLLNHYGTNSTPAGFKEAYLDYGYYYNAPVAEQIARYGKTFGSLTLKQGHSRLLAYVANERKNATLAAQAWSTFFTTDGLKPSSPWNVTLVSGPQVLTPVEEAPWLSTNDMALYGYAAIENLALAREGLR